MGNSAWIISDETSMNILTKPNAQIPAGSLTLDFDWERGVSTAIVRYAKRVVAIFIAPRVTTATRIGGPPNAARFRRRVDRIGLSCGDAWHWRIHIVPDREWPCSEASVVLPVHWIDAGQCANLRLTLERKIPLAIRSAGSTVAATSYQEYGAWDVPTRWFHWINALAVLALIVLNDDALGLSASGKILAKTVHVSFGYVMAANLVFRFVWAFLGNRYTRWRGIVPGGAGYLTALRAYTASFLAGEPQQYVGHNPLARIGRVLAVLASRRSVSDRSGHRRNRSVLATFRSLVRAVGGGSGR
jgi:hypothetical protein